MRTTQLSWLLLLALLTACGGSSSTSSGASPSTPPTTPPTNPPNSPTPNPNPNPNPTPNPVPNPPLGNSALQFQIDASKQQPISRYIYGSNIGNRAISANERGQTLFRLGGNRWTAYNWENNASNAGEDWHNQSDAYLGGGQVPGEAVRSRVADYFANDAAALVTVPIQGYVAADKNGGGDVNQSPNYLQTRFNRTHARKGSSLQMTPDLFDGAVYQDEFVNFLEQSFPGAIGNPRNNLFFSLDNEPGLWALTHPRIQQTGVLYDELLRKSIDFASAIKDTSPNATVFGFVSYGWAAMTGLQGASDARGRDFTDFFLSEMRQEDLRQGRRLLDVLDLHWYPEARGGGQRITSNNSDPALIRARLQAPRSLWDPSYQEDSWIVQSGSGAIRLLPRVKDQIQRSYPGTKLAITEYNYGGTNHISGAIAQADVLGIFAREGLFAACYWPLNGDSSFVEGAFKMFRDFDGAGGAFGDTLIGATTNDVEKSSIYASVDSQNPQRMVLIAINKDSQDQSVDIGITHTQTFTSATLYRLTESSSRPVSAGSITGLTGNQLSSSLPARSITTIVLQP